MKLVKQHFVISHFNDLCLFILKQLGNYVEPSRFEMLIANLTHLTARLIV